MIKSSNKKKRFIILKIFVLLVLVACPLILLIQSANFNKIQDNNPKILILGIDGMEWNIIYPLIEQGKLPNIKKLMDGGVYGPLKSLEPLKSPLIWNTISTGRTPEEHGIIDFFINNQTYTSKHRKTPALWNLLSDNNKSVGVVNYWASWPAEEVNGFIISDRYEKFFWKFAEGEENDTNKASELNLIHPPHILDSFMESEKEKYTFSVISEELNRFSKYKFSQLHMTYDINSTDDEFYNYLLSRVYWGYLEDKTRTEIILHILANQQQPEFLIVYLAGTDYVSHKFWQYYQQEINFTPFNQSALDKEEELFSNMIPLFYEYVDNNIGRIIRQVDNDTNIIILSDHGFKAFLLDDYRLRRYIKGDHRIYGVFIANGPEFRKKGLIDELSVYDITPLVLYLNNIKKDKKMTGKIPKKILNSQGIFDYLT